MKNIVWAILGILIVVAIVFLAKKDGGMMNNNDNGGAQAPAQAQKVFIDDAGNELRATVTPESADISFAGVGNVTLKGVANLSGVTYRNADDSIVFFDAGLNATLTKDGTVVFSGALKDSASNWTQDTPKKGEGKQGELVGTKWMWEKTVMNDGTVISPKKAGAYSLTFTKDGNVSGDTDCNDFSGTYTVGVDNAITFGPFVSTLMFCEGSQETEFSTAVSQSTRTFFDDAGNLVLLLPYDSGSVIFRK